MAEIGALLDMNSLNLSEISKTIANNIIIPNMKKKVDKNFFIMYLSRIESISYKRCFKVGINWSFHTLKVPA